MTFPTFTEIVRETLRKKSLGRISVNSSLKGVAVSGRVLDVGAPGRKPSYWRYLDAKGLKRRTSVDLMPANEPDIVADVCAGLPFADACFDAALCFNLLEHVAEPQKVVDEIHRLVADHGVLIGSVPFMVGVHGDPGDYRRFTAQALKEMFATAGFRDIKVTAVGGPFASAYEQVEDFYPWILRVIKAPCVILLDRIIAALFPKHVGRNPGDYVFICRK